MTKASFEYVLSARKTRPAVRHGFAARAADRGQLEPYWADAAGLPAATSTRKRECFIRDPSVPALDTGGERDTHRNNFPMLREHRCPVFDDAISGLLEYMAARDLLDETLVVAIGEFGRSPKIGKPTTDNVGPGGLDHWPECYTCLIADGGVRGGQVYGESDRDGACPKNSPVQPHDLNSTIYYTLGIALSIERGFPQSEIR